MVAGPENYAICVNIHMDMLGHTTSPWSPLEALKWWNIVLCKSLPIINIEDALRASTAAPLHSGPCGEPRCGTPRKKHEKLTPKPRKNRCPVGVCERSRGRSWAILAPSCVWKSLWPFLAGPGRAKMEPRWAQKAPRWAKLAPSWRDLAAKRRQEAPKRLVESFLADLGGICVVSWRKSCKAKNL